MAYRKSKTTSHTIASVESFKLVIFKQHFCHGFLYGLEVEERFCDNQCCVVEVHLPTEQLLLINKLIIMIVLVFFNTV